MDDERSAHQDDRRGTDARHAGQRLDERGGVTPARRHTGPEFYSDVDDASESSFPASDPPAWMGLRPGGPESSPGER